jgi:hypothetical protein
MAVAQSEEDEGQAAARSSAAARLAARRAAKAAAKASKRGTAPILPTQVGRGVQSARTWYEQHQRTLLLSIVGGALAVVGWFAIASQLDKQAHEAAELLGGALTTAAAPIVPPGSEPPTGPAPEESYPTAQARAEKARAEFANVSKRFATTTEALWATVGEANALLELGKPAEAEKRFASVAAQKDLEPFLASRALEGLGFALEAQQKFADASQRFAQIGALQHGAYKVISDYHQARMNIALGQKQKAADALQALVKAERARPPGEGVHFDAIVGDAETLLTELSVELNAPKLRADIPSGGGAPASPHGGGPAAGQGAALTQEIIDSLRKQLGTGKGGKGLTKDIVDQLEKQVQSGTSNATTTKVPAPKTGEKPQ